MVDLPGLALVCCTQSVDHVRIRTTHCKISNASKIMHELNTEYLDYLKDIGSTAYMGHAGLYT